MQNYYDVFNDCTTLGGMYDNFDSAVDVTKPEEMETINKIGSGFKDMSEITPEMIERFMLGKIDRINAVHDRAEELEKIKVEERGERYGNYAKRYADEQKRANFGMNDIKDMENKNSITENCCDWNQNQKNHVFDDYDECHVPTFNPVNSENEKYECECSAEKNEIKKLKNEIDEIKEMMQQMLSMQKKQEQPMFDN